MSLNWVEIDQVLAELDLAGSFLQEIKQSDYHNLLLDFRKPGRSIRLLVSLTQGKTRLHALTAKPQTLPSPPRFVQFLRAHLEGCRVLSVAQLGQERLVRFRLQGQDEEYNLWIRLWGGAANVIVTDRTHTIQEAMFRRPRSRETKGEVFDPESAPPAAKPAPPGKYALRDLPGEGTYNERLEAWYVSGTVEDEAQARERARRLLEGRLASTLAALEKTEIRRNEYSRGEDFKVYGDMISAFAFRLKRGDTVLKEGDFRDQSQVEIPLDPQLAPFENAEKYYKKHAKARDGRQRVEDEARELQREKTELESAIAAVGVLEPSEIREIVKKFQRPAPSAKDEKNPRPGLEFRSGAFTIYVGRNSKENDELLRRWVRGNDLWFHTRDVPGGFVFIRQIPGKSVPLETILDAGNLAVHYSKAKSEGQADLYYTQVKYLRRAKDGPAALVLPTQEKNLTIKVDPDRLARLQAPEEGP